MAQQEKMSIDRAKRLEQLEDEFHCAKDRCQTWATALANVVCDSGQSADLSELLHEYRIARDRLFRATGNLSIFWTEGDA